MIPSSDKSNQKFYFCIDHKHSEKDIVKNITNEIMYLKSHYNNFEAFKTRPGLRTPSKNLF